MGIDISVERPITFNQAAKYLPDECRPNQATWWRWRRRGRMGICLETIVIGGRRYTTAESVIRWVGRVTAAANGESAPIRTAMKRQRDIDRAAAELAREGIGPIQTRQGGETK